MRNKGGLIWVDLRDRYGVTQLIFEEDSTEKELLTKAASLGREFVIQATGLVIERASKNDKMPTGDIEIKVKQLEVLNAAKVPPFIIEDETDGGEELRMKYRYLDLRRNVIRKIAASPQMMQETRNIWMGKTSSSGNPVLIKSRLKVPGFCGAKWVNRASLCFAPISADFQAIADGERF